MRIYQRTGPDTGVSYGLGSVLVGVVVLIILGGMLIEAVSNADASVSIFLGGIAALVVGVWALGRYATKDERAEQREHDRLAAMEHYEEIRAAEAKAEDSRVADLQRLRAKYKA